MTRKQSLIKQLEKKTMKATGTFINTMYFPLSLIDNRKKKNILKASIKQYTRAEKEMTRWVNSKEY